MPRFERLIGEFELTTGEGGDEVLWRFARTPAVERDFTVAEAESPGVRRTRALLAVMLGALTEWEGVLDAEGRALPYSEAAFLGYIPAVLRLAALQRWAQVMRGGEVLVPSGPSGDAPTESMSGPGVVPPSSWGATPGRAASLSAVGPSAAIGAVGAVPAPSPERASVGAGSQAVPEASAPAALEPLASLGEMAPSVDQRAVAPELPTDAGKAQPAPPLPTTASAEEAIRAAEPTAAEQALGRTGVRGGAAVAVRRQPAPVLDPIAGPDPIPTAPEVTAAQGGVAAGMRPGNGWESAQGPSRAQGPTGPRVATDTASSVARDMAPHDQGRGPMPALYEPVWADATAAMGPSLADTPLGADSWLDSPDLDLEPRFMDAVEKVVRRLEQRRAHEPVF